MKLIRWCIYIVLSIGIACIGIDLACLEIGYNTTYYEIQVLINNRPELIGYAWLWIVLLVEGNFGYDKAEKTPIKALSKALLKSAILVIAFHLIVFIVSAIQTNSIPNILINEWSYENELSIAKITPIAAVIISAILLICRITWTLLVIYICNAGKKHALAIVLPFVFFLFDWQFYYTFKISKPLFITPIEHTRIFYTEAYAPNVDGSPRVSFIISFTYWIVLICILLVFIHKIGCKHKDNKTTLLPFYKNWRYWLFVPLLVVISFFSAINTYQVDYGAPLSKIGWINVFRLSFIERCPTCEILNSLVIGCLQFTIIEKNKNYADEINKRLTASFISAFITMFCFEITVLGISIIISPISPTISIPYGGSFSALLSRSNVGFVAIYILYTSIVAGCFACLSMNLYEISNDATLAILVPSFSLTSYLPFSWSLSNYLLWLIPDSPLNPASNQLSSVKRIIDLAVLIIIVFTTYIVNKKRRSII